MRRFHSPESERKREQRKRNIHPSDREWADGWTKHWNKQSPYDCGNASCGICSQPSYPDRPRTKKWEESRD